MVLAMVFAYINVAFNISKYMLSVCTIRKQLVYIVHIYGKGLQFVCLSLLCIGVGQFLYVQVHNSVF